MIKMFADNRKRLHKELPDGALLVLFSGEAPAMRGDEAYPFTPQRNLFYITGIDRPGVIYACLNRGGKLEETVFLRRFDETRAKWVGREMTAGDVAELVGEVNCSFTDEFDGYVSGVMARGYASQIWLDLENQSLTAPPHEDVRFAAKLRAAYPALTIVNAYPVFGRLRACKSKAEVKHIREAVRVTGEAFSAMLDNACAGMYEYELEAHIDYVFKRNNCGRAFATIAAGGANAAVLHYVDNDKRIEDGQMALVDFGAQSGWYSADVTRTFPVNGKFTERQRLLYDIVLGGNLLVIKHAKPGATLLGLNDLLKEYYVKELKKIGLISKKQQLSDYYYHGVSHPLGLETHDAGRGVGMPEELGAGAVITVEPGLYIAEEGIGIRIEDDVLITEDGCEVLTKDIIKTADEIEAYMARVK